MAANRTTVGPVFSPADNSCAVVARSGIANATCSDLVIRLRSTTTGNDELWGFTNFSPTLNRTPGLDVVS